MKWPHTLRSLADKGEPFVIVTVAGTRGSTPREVGAKMFVTAKRTIGTIGGGQLEYECTSAACLWFREQTSARTYTRTFTLGAHCGQCCGGVAEILFEQIVPADVDWLDELGTVIAKDTPAAMITAGDSRTGVTKRFITAETPIADDDLVAQSVSLRLKAHSPASRMTVALPGNLQVAALYEPLQDSHFEIVLFGAGHVGSAMVASLAALNCRVTWIDSRSGVFPAELPANIIAISRVAPHTVVDETPSGRYYLIMTHSHAMDLEICARILARDDFAYCGLIGSRSKRRQFEKRLRALGLSDQQLQRLTCPIGIDGIHGKKPAEIAIATTAQLLQLRERESLQQGSSTSGRKRQVKR